MKNRLTIRGDNNVVIQGVIINIADPSDIQFFLRQFSEQLSEIKEELFNIRANSENQVKDIANYLIREIAFATSTQDDNIRLTEIPYFDPNRLIGRDDFLMDIHSKLSGRSPSIVLLNGIAGIGKTSVALAYVYSEKYSDYYNHIAWVNNENEILISIINTFSELVIGFNYSEALSAEKNFESLIKCLSKTTKGNNLLVIDRCDDLSNLIECRTHLRKLNWNILITTRTNPEIFKNKVQLPKLDDDSLLSIFKSYYKKEDDDYFCEEIIELVKKHTLLVEVIAKVGQANPDLDLKKLFSILKGGDYENGNLNITITHEIINDTFNQGFFNFFINLFETTYLKEEELLILKFMTALPSSFSEFQSLVDYFLFIKFKEFSLKKYSIFTMMYSNFIVGKVAGKAFTKARGFQDFIRLKKLTKNKKKFINILNSLYQKGWILRTGNMFKIHELIKKTIIIKLGLDCDYYSIFAHNISLKIGRSLEYSFKDTKNAATYAKSLLSMFSDYNFDFIQLSGNLGIIYEKLGRADLAIPYHENAIEAIKNNENKVVRTYLLQEYNNLGGAYMAAYMPDEALKHLNKSLELIKSHNLPIEEKAKIHMNKATAYRYKGNYNKAVKVHLESLEMVEAKKGGKYDRIKINIKTNLASAYAHLEKYEEGEKVAEEALEMILEDEQAYGYDEFDLIKATACNNLGICKMHQNKFSKAEIFINEAIKIRKALLPPQHQNIIESEQNLIVLKRLRSNNRNRRKKKKKKKKK